jgi:Ca2+-binding EF-hand superfamily protein
MEAFKSGKWQNSIDAYTRAIELDADNAVFYQNRAAAYIKAGEFEKALQDAEECIRLNPEYDKGHVRKGAALQAMRQYDESITAYKVGLNFCHKNEHLQTGLAFANRAKHAAKHSKVQQAAHTSRVAHRAAVNRSIQAQQAPTPSAFVQETRLELKLQMTALQAQLDLLDELASMSDNDKLEVLFTLVDEDHDGKVDARELSNAIRKRNNNKNLSFADSLDRAMDMVAIFDADGDAKLDLQEFSEFVNNMAEELGGGGGGGAKNFHEISEFLILQIVFSGGTGNTVEEDLALEVMAKGTTEISDEVKAREELLDMLSDERLSDIFKLFDKDGSGTLSFTEVAVGLNQLTHDMEESAKTTLQLLLLLDKDNVNSPQRARTMDYEQFARFMMAFVAALDMTFDQAADSILVALSKKDDNTAEDDLAGLLLADEIYQDAVVMQKDMTDEEAKVADAFSYGRLQKLFDLWDKDKSGSIDFKELVAGLNEFQQAAGFEDDAERQAAALLGYDTDGDMKLDPREFSRAMLRYAKAYEVELQDLIDFMCVTTTLSEDKSKCFSSAYRQSFTTSLSEKNMEQVVGTNRDYYEEPNDDEYFT